MARKKNKFLHEAIGGYLSKVTYFWKQFKKRSTVEKLLQKRIIRQMQRFQSAAHQMGDLQKGVVRTVFGKELISEFLSFVDDSTKTIEEKIQQVFDELNMNVEFVLEAGVDLRTFVLFLVDLAKVVAKRKKPDTDKEELALIKMEFHRLVEVRYPGLYMLSVERFLAVFDSVEKIVLVSERFQALGLCVGPEYTPAKQGISVATKGKVKCYVFDEGREAVKRQKGQYQIESQKKALTGAKSRSKN